jgi:hypothetical protein
MLQVCLEYLDACALPKSVQTSLEREFSSVREQDNNINPEDSCDDDNDGEPYDAIDSFDNRSGRARAEDKKHQEIQDLRSSHPLMSYMLQKVWKATSETLQMDFVCWIHILHPAKTRSKFGCWFSGNNTDVGTYNLCTSQLPWVLRNILSI